MLRHEVGELHRGGRLGEEGARTGAEREDDEHPEAEGEGQRRRARDDVVGSSREHVAAEGVVDGEHVAVEVRGDLGDAGACPTSARRARRRRPRCRRRRSRSACRRSGGSGRPRPRRRRPPRRGRARPCRGPSCTSSANRWSTSATAGRVFSTIGVSSVARSAAIVVTTTPPALSTASQAATVHGLLGERSSTRLPGTRPRSSTSTWATWSARSLQLAVGPGGAVRGAEGRPVGAVLGDDGVEELVARR